MGEVLEQPDDEQVKRFRYTVDETAESIGWSKVLEVIRDSIMNDATAHYNQVGKEREVLYYMSKAIEGAMGLARQLKRR